MDEASKKNKEIEKIKKKLASMSLSPEERNNYEYRLRAIRDEADAIEFATRKGLEQGIEQTAKEMLKNNFTIEQIQTITKLTREEIEKLKNKK